ncbi:MAG: hypothetical protein U5N58_03215 [Actinomycetota bacterium]|nr:hypothetical protein [Actinomycetota bacterium]
MKNNDSQPVHVGMIGFGYIASGVYSLVTAQAEYIAEKKLAKG